MDPTKFVEWLRNQGAQVMPCTTPYEIARFIAHGKTNVVYMNQRGGIRAIGFAMQCVEMFETNGRMAMGYARKASKPMQKRRQALIERDGPWCFFCHQEMAFDDSTIEHLVSKMRGGPDHIDNLVLAHERCNLGVDNLSLMDKIRIREANLEHRTPEAKLAANAARIRITPTNRIGLPAPKRASDGGVGGVGAVEHERVRGAAAPDRTMEKGAGREAGEGVSRTVQPHGDAVGGPSAGIGVP